MSMILCVKIEVYVTTLTEIRYRNCPGGLTVIGKVPDSLRSWPVPA